MDLLLLKNGSAVKELFPMLVYKTLDKSPEKIVSLQHLQERSRHELWDAINPSYYFITPPQWSLDFEICYPDWNFEHFVIILFSL